MTYLFNDIQKVSKDENPNTSTNPVFVQPVTNATNNFTFVKYADSTNTQLDAVGRLRVSPSTHSYWYIPSVDKDGDLRYQEVYSGTNAGSWFCQNLAKIRCSSGTTNAGSFIRASRRRHKMRPGVSLNWLATLNFNGCQTNVTKKRGLCTQYNGVWMEVTDDLYLVFRKRLQDGTLVETRIKRDAFNVDRLNGTAQITAGNFVVGKEYTIRSLGTTVWSDCGAPAGASVGTTFVASSIGSGTGIAKQWNYPFNPTGYNLDPRDAATYTGASGATFNVTYVSKSSGITVGSETYYQVVYSITGSLPDNWNLGDHVLIQGLTGAGYNQKCMLVAKSSGSITVSYFTDPGSAPTGAGKNGTIYTDGLYKVYTWSVDFDGDRTTHLRFCVHTEEGPQVVHIENYSGMFGTKWASAPAMPDRIEMFNTGAVTYTPTMYVGSTSVNVEAELEINPGFGIASNNNSIEYTKQNTEEHAIVGVGLRTGEPYQRADLQIQSIQLQDIANVNPQNAAPFCWRLLLNPTITAGNPSPIDIGKATHKWEYTTSTTWTGGIELLSGYCTSATLFDTRMILNFLNMGSNPDNTSSDLVVLVAKKLASNSTANPLIVGLINYIESL